MSQQDLLKNEVIEELIREKSYHYISQNKKRLISSHHHVLREFLPRR